MRHHLWRLLPVALVLPMAACVLDPRGALKNAALHIEVVGLSGEPNSVDIEVRAPDLQVVSRSARVDGSAQLDFYFPQIAPGDYTLRAHSVATDRHEVRCLPWEAMSVTGSPLDLVVDLEGPGSVDCSGTAADATTDAGPTPDAVPATDAIAPPPPADGAPPQDADVRADHHVVAHDAALPRKDADDDDPHPGGGGGPPP